MCGHDNVRSYLFVKYKGVKDNKRESSDPGKEFKIGLDLQTNLNCLITYILFNFNNSIVRNSNLILFEKERTEPLLAFTYFTYSVLSPNINLFLFL